MVYRTIQLRKPVSGGGTVLPAGTYVGQPLAWDGLAWGPSGSVAVTAVNSADGLSSGIEFPDATPGFPTIARWFVETSNIFQVERDNVLFRRRVLVVGNPVPPLEMIAPDVGPPQIGFLGSAPVVRPVVAGSRGGNAALASLLTALDLLGLIDDTTTA